MAWATPVFLPTLPSENSVSLLIQGHQSEFLQSD